MEIFARYDVLDDRGERIAEGHKVNQDRSLALGVDFCPLQIGFEGRGGGRGLYFKVRPHNPRMPGIMIRVLFLSVKDHN